MTARFASYNTRANCCSGSAAACSSARMIPVLDAAVLLVVSIFVLSLRIMGLPA